MINNNLSIEEIEQREGIEVEPIVYIDSSISIWYHEVRKKRLSQLTDGDVARFIRQQVFLKYLVPEAIRRLWENPTIGELYDGEVLKQLSTLNKEFWNNNQELKQELLDLLNSIETKRLIPSDFEWISNEDEKDFTELVWLLKEKLDN
jgi:hypothetical protein